MTSSNNNNSNSNNNNNNTNEMYDINDTDDINDINDTDENNIYYENDSIGNELLELHNSLHRSLHTILSLMHQLDSNDKLWKKLNKLSCEIADASIFIRRII